MENSINYNITSKSFRELKAKIDSIIKFNVERDIDPIIININGVEEKYRFKIDSFNEATKIMPYIYEFLKENNYSNKSKQECVKIFNYLFDVISKREGKLGKEADSLKSIFYLKSSNMFVDNEGNLDFSLSKQIIKSLENKDNKELKNFIENKLYSGYMDILNSHEKFKNISFKNILKDCDSQVQKILVLLHFGKTFFVAGKHKNNKEYTKTFFDSFIDLSKNENFKENFKEAFKSIILFSNGDTTSQMIPLTELMLYLIENDKEDFVKNIYTSIKEISNDNEVQLKCSSAIIGLQSLCDNLKQQVIEEIEKREIDELEQQIDEELFYHISKESKYAKYKEILKNDFKSKKSKWSNNNLFESAINMASNSLDYLKNTKNKAIEIGSNVINSSKKLFGKALSFSSGVVSKFWSLKKEGIKKVEINVNQEVFKGNKENIIDNKNDINVIFNKQDFDMIQVMRAKEIRKKEIKSKLFEDLEKELSISFKSSFISKI